MAKPDNIAAIAKPTLAHAIEGDHLILQIGGDWHLQESRPDSLSVGEIFQASPAVRSVSYDTEQLGEWDTGLITLLAHIQHIADQNGLENNLSNLPSGAQSLLRLAFTVWLCYSMSSLHKSKQN
jgi:hypothetical protein